MRNRNILASLVVFLAGVALSLASDMQMGIWKLNEANSKLNPAAGKNLTVVYAAAGNNVKVVIDGVDKDGKPTHNEWSGMFNGKDYPVTGDSGSDTRSYKRVDDRTLEFAVKKGGKVTISGTIVLSADGKSRTVAASGTDSSGNKVTGTAVYDKQ